MTVQNRIIGNPNLVGLHGSYDEKTKQYYLHLFDETQADLNWENQRAS